jgi:hypothetical protein
MSLAEFKQQASPEAVSLARRLFESDIVTWAWVEQVGFATGTVGHRRGGLPP